MALKAAEVLQWPDLACIGVIQKVDQVRLSERGVYHVLPIEVKGRYGARDATFFYIFMPEWFEPSFDPATLRDDPKVYGVYKRYVNDAARESVLAAIANSGDPHGFDKLAAEFDGLTNIDEHSVEQVLREYFTGREVGYIMKQRQDKDDNGHYVLVEQYNIQRFFNPTEDALVDLQKQAANPKRKTPLVITWDEE
jgi:hypothetical protein